MRFDQTTPPRKKEEKTKQNKNKQKQTKQTTVDYFSLMFN
jgi:hypothetical protein